MEEISGEFANPAVSILFILDTNQSDLSTRLLAVSPSFNTVRHHITVCLQLCLKGTYYAHFQVYIFNLVL